MAKLNEDLKMKFSIISAIGVLCCIAQTSVFAAPVGYITFYNASDKNVTAQVSSFGSFTLSSNQRRDVAYSSLNQICSSNPSHCRAQFYVNNKHAGSATINATTGQLVNLNLSMKVRTAKSENVLRSVIIK
jgi:hypothetical protein